MRIIDCGPLAVCTDCILLIANDDDSTDYDHRKVFADWQSEYGDNGVLVPGDKVTDFSSSRCDGCGSTLAGTRHEVFAVEPEDDGSWLADALNREAEETMLGRPLFPNEY